MKTQTLKNSSFTLRISSKPPSLEYHLDSRSLAENHRISSGREGNKACRRCVLRVSLTDSFFFFSFLFLPFFFFPLFPIFPFLLNEHLLHAASWAWNRFRCTRYPATSGGHPAIFHRRVFPSPSPLLTADSFRSTDEILPLPPSSPSLPSTSFQPPSKTESRPAVSGFFGFIHAKLAARSPLNSGEIASLEAGQPRDNPLREPSPDERKRNRAWWPAKQVRRRGDCVVVSIHCEGREGEDWAIWRKKYIFICCSFRLSTGKKNNELFSSFLKHNFKNLSVKKIYISVWNVTFDEEILITDWLSRSKDLS